MKPDTDEPDHEPHIERMIDRADYLRTERKDREWEWQEMTPKVEPMHVYDWIVLPPTNDAERDAKEWLDRFTMPAYHKMFEGGDEWLAKYRVTVEWKGKRYLCSGASRMGDVWLRNDGSQNFYDRRVCVSELSNWKRTNQPSASE